MSSWFTTYKPNPHALFRMFCFPHAGAGASIFRSWASSLPKEIELCGIQYPGRETRSEEPPLRSMAAVLNALAPAIVPFLDLPFVFAGYSMGSLISFELSRALFRERGLKPEHAFFCAAKAPHIREKMQLHQLPAREFLMELIHMNGIPADVLRHADMVRHILPILRADFSICETYKYEPGALLEFPITAYGGERDPRVERQDLEAWSCHAGMYFSSAIFSGDHFFLRTAHSSLLRAIVRELQPLLSSICPA
jgi:medium-chain acyl-[acyl-carrier-protein] hydrolase